MVAGKHSSLSWPSLVRSASATLLAAALACHASDSVAEGPGIEPAVVRILSYAQRGDWTSPWSESHGGWQSGSGFVIQDGQVMTNAHVVSDSRMILIFLNGDPVPHEARVSAIGHDCDLALLTPLEKGLLDPIVPVVFGGLPALRATVETYGYPAGGERLSSTRGVVSRIELQPYVHTGVSSHLTVQTDAAINPGNSGGPVVEEGKVVGVAFQTNTKLSNVGFFVPSEVIEHFLKDVTDGTYDGYPEIGFLKPANMENPAARRKAGMSAAQTGVRVPVVLPGSSSDGHLRAGDTLLSIEGAEIANDGTVTLNGLRFDFGVLIDRKQVGETLAVRILRDGQTLDVAVPLKTYPPADRFARSYDRPPRYFVYAGLVFLPLDRDLLETFGEKWSVEADPQLLYEYHYRFLEEPARITREPVVLLRCLDHPVNARMAWTKNMLVERVNGRPIDSLEDLVRAVETNTENPYQTFEFAPDSGLNILDRQEADRANQQILKTYGVTKDRRL